MPKYEMFVDLKIPDTTARTAFHTLEKLGFDKLKKLKRYDYYYFETEEHNFPAKIMKVDILVNHNKHRAQVIAKGNISDKPGALITNTDETYECTINTLEALGIHNIKSMKKGVYWEFDIEAKDKKEYAKKIVESLLYNEHYQEYTLR